MNLNDRVLFGIEPDSFILWWKTKSKSKSFKEINLYKIKLVFFWLIDFGYATKKYQTLNKIS